MSISKRSGLTTSFEPTCDPWRLLRKRWLPGPRRGIRLVVHGSSGGKIHPCFYELMKDVQNLRGMDVHLEAITSGSVPSSKDCSVWLVPLFLLPGQHVRHDIPSIRRRLRNEGITTNLLPFLGSWLDWLLILKNFIKREALCGVPALIHHPLRPGVSRRYLRFLEKQLHIPIVSWNDWKEYEISSNLKFSPIPYALTPNSIPEDLIDEGGISSLLEIDSLRLALIHFLSLLP